MRKLVMGMMTTLNGRLDDPNAWMTEVPDDLYAVIDRRFETFTHPCRRPTTGDDSSTPAPNGGGGSETQNMAPR